MTLWTFNRWKSPFIGFDIIDETKLAKGMTTVNECMSESIKVVTDMASKHIGELFVSYLVLDNAK